MDDLTAMLERLLLDRKGCQLAPEPEYECPICKDRGYILFINEEGYEVCRQCQCAKVREARRLMEKSGITEEFRKKTFDNFHTGANRQLNMAKEKAQRFVADFEKTERDRHNSILLCGQVGAGKTHLGTAICGELMGGGVAVIYMAYRNVITKIKQNMIDENVYTRELNLYSTARVLYIDDLLKGRITEADVNIMYEIVNYRYMNNLPMIISTEKTQGELIAFDEAIGSRILEMCRGNIIQLQGKELNYRIYGLRQ